MPTGVAKSDRSSVAKSGLRLEGWQVAILPLLVCVPLLVARIKLLLTPLPMHDFVTYWAAGRLFLSGGNPYSISATYAMEQSMGWIYSRQLVMLNPPWMLPIVAPLALLPFEFAHHLWFAICLLLEVVCSLALWRYFGGEKGHQWMALLLLATYLPAGAAEHYGQITPLILAGITLFLFALRWHRYVLAGACLAVLGLKPHLLYLVLLAILLWSVRERKWSIPIAAYLLALGGSLAAIAFNHTVLGYFRGTVQAAVDTDCGVGGGLRGIFGVQHVWLQFLPSMVGVVWFAFYWKRHRNAWVWEKHLPLLLLVSIGSAAYFWVHDFVIAIPALIALAVQVDRARVWHIVTVTYLMVQVVILNCGRPAACTASLLWIALYWIGMLLCAPSAKAMDLGSSESSVVVGG